MYKVCILLSIVYFASGTLRAQAPSFIDAYPIQITFNKTTSLVFPYPVKSVDRGSRDILVQVLKDADTILQLKAARVGFTETNLSVVTADGKFHLFLVSYIEQPRIMAIRFFESSNQALVQKPLPFSSYKLPDAATIEQSAAAAEKADNFLHAHTKAEQVKLSIKGLYLKDNLLWFVLEVKNKSYVPYTAIYGRFFIKDKKRSKRTAQQETELTPLFQNMMFTAGKSHIRCVFGLEQFTLSKGKELILQIGEKNAGRELILPISHNLILKARPLP